MAVIVLTKTPITAPTPINQEEQKIAIKMISPESTLFCSITWLTPLKVDFNKLDIFTTDLLLTKKF